MIIYSFDKSGTHYRKRDLTFRQFMKMKEKTYKANHGKNADDWHESENILWAMDEWIGSCEPLNESDRKWLAEYDNECLAYHDDILDENEKLNH